MDNVFLWLLTVAYAAHILEEYVLDWRTWAEKSSGLKMEWTEFFVANFAVIIFGIAAAAVGFGFPIFSYMFVGLATVNALFAHIGTTIVKKRFSPGLITSVFLFLPLSAWAYYIAWQKGILTIPFISITVLGGFLIMGFPILLQLIKPKRIKNLK